MALAQHRLADGQRLLVEGLGGGVVPLRLQQLRQVVQALGGVGVLRAQCLFADGQGLTGLRRGLAIAALSIKLLDLLIQPLGLGQPAVGDRLGRRGRGLRGRRLVGERHWRQDHNPDAGAPQMAQTQDTMSTPYVTHGGLQRAEQGKEARKALPDAAVEGGQQPGKD